MTREEARHWLEIELKTWEDECKSKHPIKEALSVAIKALEQEPILDKIRAEIEDWQTDVRDNDAEIYDFIFERIYEIFDEYKAESEEKHEN